MLHLEYSLRTEKKNTSAQKHIYHKHMTLQQGEHIQLWQAAIRSSAICGAGLRPARPSGGTKHFRGSWMGEGSNVCNGGREQESLHCIALSGWLSRRPWPRRWYGEPEDKIKLLWLLGRTAAKFPQLILFVHSDLWNHQVSLPKLRVSSWWYPYSGPGL